MTTHAPRPILVGIDGSNHSSRALDWAITEATSRSLPLHLVHVLETGVTVWSPMMVAKTDLEDYRWIIETALEHVHKNAPSLPVTSAITTGPASVALENASVEADTLVVGARGRGVVKSILLGSTSLHAASHAHCRSSSSETPTRLRRVRPVAWSSASTVHPCLVTPWPTRLPLPHTVTSILTSSWLGTPRTSSHTNWFPRSPKRCGPPRSTTAVS